MSSNLTDVLTGPGAMGTATVKYGMDALAAAAADGPLVEDVECGTCGGEGWVPDDPTADEDGSQSGCPTCAYPGNCGGTGTVRIVVITEEMLRERLADALTDLFNVDDEQVRYAVARIIGGEL